MRPLGLRISIWLNAGSVFSYKLDSDVDVHPDKMEAKTPRIAMTSSLGAKVAQLFTDDIDNPIWYNNNSFNKFTLAIFLNYVEALRCTFGNFF